NARPLNFNWNYHFGYNHITNSVLSTNNAITTTTPSSFILPNSTIGHNNNKHQWMIHHNVDYDNHNNSNNNNNIHHDYDSDVNQAAHFVGLKNGGATCYMNSIIQQLFTLEPIRDCVLSANPEIVLANYSNVGGVVDKQMNTFSALKTETNSHDNHIIDNVCEQTL
ncbi:unnamed protein product, partial [Schistosoma turkestanicum]